MSFLTSIVNSHQYYIQESRISSETPWRTLWKLKGECPLPVHLEVWNFEQSFFNIYICHSGHPKSSTLHSGIKNVLQDSLKEALDPHKRMFSKTLWLMPWRLIGDLKFCTELPKCLYKSFLIHKVHCQLDSILESKMSSQTPWRTQRKVGVL